VEKAFASSVRVQRSVIDSAAADIPSGFVCHATQQ
jgi:hypothetical protein